MPRNSSSKAGARSPKSGRRVRLRPANPFDLIRLIAHSQSDPRKAMAELVQNSLDAGAQTITVTRQRRRGEQVIAILDDGSGIFPEMARPEALEHIATNIGHTFKRNLSVVERQQQMLLGKYGIGILGFWAVGREMEIRTRVGDSEVWVLRLVRDEPSAEVRRDSQRQFRLAGDTWTEVLIRGVHPEASRQLTGRRLGEYLGSELRGQLLARDVRLRMVDRIATGRTLKDFLVVPRRFHGKRIDAVTRLEVPGFAPASLELYLADASSGDHGDGPGGDVSLSCGGTTVADRLADVGGYDIDQQLWGGGSLEGIVDFPDLEVAPTTRRGFMPGPAAEAFFASLKTIETRLRAVLENEEARRLAEEEVDLAKEIRRVFRPLARALPQYDFFRLAGVAPGSVEVSERDEGARIGRTTGSDEGEAPEADAGAAVEESAGDDVSPDSEVVDDGDLAEPPPEIIPPGPLASARIVPRKCRLLPAASRSLLVKALDETGRPVEEALAFVWRIEKGDGSLLPNREKALFTAPASPGETVVAVEVRSGGGDRVVEATATLETVEKLAGESPDAGIPEPRRAFDPKGDWRSRVRGGTWEYNAAHPDYQAVVESSKLRLRYLVHLFAKEIVLENYGTHDDERVLERMVEVLTHVQLRS